VYTGDKPKKSEKIKKTALIFILVWCGISGLARNSELIITTPRSEFGLDKFYKKYTDASGILIVSS
jgi:hypothetical protein